jgi:hypothetical protein
MRRRLLSSLLMLVVLLAGIGPIDAELSAAGASPHACCQTIQPGTPHDGCPKPSAARMQCCAPSPDRKSETQAPAGTMNAPRPDFTLLAGHAAHVPGLPALVGASVAHAFEWARLKLPRTPIYLRDLVLLV